MLLIRRDELIPRSIVDHGRAVRHASRGVITSDRRITALSADVIAEIGIEVGRWGRHRIGPTKLCCPTVTEERPARWTPVRTCTRVPPGTAGRVG